MKRTWILVILMAFAALYLIGCSSPMQKAQKLMAEGKYEEVIAAYGSNPELASIVADAKEKLAVNLFNEGKYQEVLDNYPESAAAKEAMSKLADMLFAEGKFQEVIDKYPGTPAAAKAQVELDKQKQAEESAGNVADRNAKAEAKLKEIMAVKVKALRDKALKEFVDNPLYKGTPAAKKAADALKK